MICINTQNILKEFRYRNISPQSKYFFLTLSTLLTILFLSRGLKIIGFSVFLFGIFVSIFLHKSWLRFDGFTFIITYDGLVITNKDIKTLFLWENMLSIIEYDNGHIIVMKNGLELPICKRLEHIDFFVDIIREKIG